MKKFLLTAFAAMAMQAAFAQNSAVTSAILYKDKGTFDKAKTEIDKAVVHEKTKDSPKAWYNKGVIYQEMAVHPIYSKTIDPPKISQEAFDAYMKVLELEKNEKKKQYTKEVEERLPGLKDNLYALSLNAGAAHHNNKEYAEARKAYLQALNYRPNDSLVLLYSGFAAMAEDDFAGAKKFHGQLIDLKKAPIDSYTQMLYIVTEVDKSDQEALALLEKARAAYPEDRNFMIQELNLYLKAGKEEESLAKINNAIKADPSNANLYTVRGSLYERIKKENEAIADYKKAFELAPSNFDAVYNLGAIYFNKGFNQAKKARAMSLAEYKKNGKAVEAEAKKFFAQALPYFESAVKIKPDDRTTIKALVDVYTTLERPADAKRMDAKLQQL